MASTPMSQRDLAAVQDAGEQVAAELVGAEQVAVGERRQPALRRGPASFGSGSGSTRASSDRERRPAGRRSRRPRS